MTRDVGLREQKKEHARQSIVQEALRLFSQQGFDGTTVDEITAAAGISRRTFFRYFDKKEDVVLDWLDEVGELIVEALDSRPSAEAPLLAVRAAMRAVVESYRHRAADALAAVDLIEATPVIQAREREKQGAWEAAVAQQLERRLGRSTAARRRARLLAALSIAALSSSVASWRAERGRPDLAELVDAAFDLIAADA